MSRYRKVHVKIWNDEKFMSFTDDGKLAFLFLLTHPHMTSLGAMRASVAGLAAEMGWNGVRMEEALGPAILARMIVMDKFVAFVWIPRFLDYNPPESPNVVRSWPPLTELIPECQSKKFVFDAARACCESLGEGFREAFREGFGEAFRKGMPNPEPEPEPEPEQEPKKVKSIGDGQDPAAPRPKFQRPTLEQVKAYIVEKGYQVDGEKWFDYYSSNGWKVGRNPMRDWQAAVRTWARGTSGGGSFNGQKRVVGAAAPVPGKYGRAGR